MELSARSSGRGVVRCGCGVEKEVLRNLMSRSEEVGVAWISQPMTSLRLQSSHEHQWPSSSTDLPDEPSEMNVCNISKKN